MYSFPSEHTSEIVQLVWDTHGTRLLSADSNGTIRTWQMQVRKLKDYILHIVYQISLCSSYFML